MIMAVALSACSHMITARSRGAVSLQRQVTRYEKPHQHSKLARLCKGPEGYPRRGRNVRFYTVLGKITHPPMDPQPS